MTIGVTKIYKDTNNSIIYIVYPFTPIRIAIIIDRIPSKPNPILAIRLLNLNQLSDFLSLSEVYL